MANLKLRYDVNTGLAGSIYPESITVPEPFLSITEEQANEISKDKNILYFVNDGNISTTKTDNYINKCLELEASITYKYIVDKYDQILKYGVFKINEDSYANMAWYDTWSKAVSLYESSGESLSTTFTVRLYKKNSNGAYYNIDTVQNLTGLKALLLTLNKQQFVLYQPIKNNLLAQLLYYKSLKNIEKLQELKQLADTDFGDSINELETIVQYGA